MTVDELKAELAGLVSANSGEPITADTIDFVSQFQPTRVQLEGKDQSEEK